jgi:hypothetical protein
MSKKDKWFDTITAPAPKQKRRVGVMPTRKEEDKRRRPPRHKREAPDALAYISHR